MQKIDEQSDNRIENNVSFISENKKKTVAFFSILLLTVLAYGNTFHASWHFDDYPNIVDNAILHIEDLEPASLYRTFFAAPGQVRYTGTRLYRPVSCLTFAINWYFGQDNVLGYHVVNMVIHILTAFLIYLCAIRILSSPNLGGKYSDSKYSIAFLSAIIWALHPIQTQAVTYIVQRMASLSAMFGLLSIWLYLVGRSIEWNKRRVFCFTGSAVAFIFAVGSKENGALIPFGIGLIELLFYQNLSSPKVRRILRFSPIFGLILLSVGIFYLDSRGSFLAYRGRDFTLVQRFMTEPRVLMMYIGQIFGPFPWRFSIEHDLLPSGSLIAPWTTLPAIFAVAGIIVAGLMQIKKRPLVAFAVLFFFLNHIVESTLIPLELVFEHRNYLPSAFVFLPICAGVISLTMRYKAKGAVVTTGILHTLVLIVPLFLLGSTFLRNDGWSTEKRLWEDAIERAPGQARPYQNLAYEYYEKIGRYDIAMALYQKALTLRMSTPKRTKTELLNSIGVLYDKAGAYQTAYEYYLKAIEVSPKKRKPRYNAAVALIGMNRFEDALEMIDALLSSRPEDRDGNNLKGSILLLMDRPEEAILYLEKSLQIDPTYYQALINFGVALYQVEEYDLSIRVLEAANTQAPGQVLPIFCLIENRLRADDLTGAETYLKMLFNSATLDDIHMVLERIGETPASVPISYGMIAPFIENNMGLFQ